VTEHDRQDRTDAAEASDATVPAPRGPVPDLGFFAGAPLPRDAGSFGGPPSQFGGPAPSQLGGPAPSQLGGPAPSQFGGPQAAPFGTPVATPFGAPAPALPGPAGQPGDSSTWKLLAAGVVVAVLLVAVFGGRFAWKQFAADPVLPDTLGGMPRIAGAEADAELAGMQQDVAGDLASGGSAKLALYTDGQGFGYVLVAVRGGSSRPGSGSDADALASWSKSEQGGTTCYSKAAQAAEGVGVTMCLQGFWRRAVAVVGMGVTPPDPALVAQVTEEAWDAQ
jgi:hypothetical protein